MHVPLKSLKRVLQRLMAVPQKSRKEPIYQERDNDCKHYTKDPTAKELKIQPTNAVTQALSLQFKMTLQQIETHSLPSFLENTGTTKHLFHIF